MEIFAILAILATAIALLMVAGGDVTPQPGGVSNKVYAFATAIAKAEGSNPAWNNPGDLTLAFSYPTSGKANSAGVLKFNNSADGWSALYKQIALIVNGGSAYYDLTTTLEDFGNLYSGGDPNWAVNVASALGVSTDTPLGSILT